MKNRLFLMLNGYQYGVFGHASTISRFSFPLIRLFFLLTSFLVVDRVHAQLELSSGSMSPNPVSIGYTIAPQTVTILNNTTGSTFASYLPTTTIKLEFQDQQYSLDTNVIKIKTGKALNFGVDTTSAIWDTLGKYGRPTSSMYTSNPFGPAMSGINTGVNYSLMLYTCTEQFEKSVPPPSGNKSNRMYMGKIVMTFNRPVNYPVLHFSGLGGISSTLGFSTEFDLVQSSANEVLDSLSGALGFSVNSTQILNSNNLYNTNCGSIVSAGGNASCGSVRVRGTNITTLVFNVYLRPDGRVAAWPSNSPISGDGYMLSVSLAPITISGNVFNDTNGLADNTINGSGNNIGGQLNMLLVDANGNLYATTPVASDGSYSFSNVVAANYTLRLSTSAGTVGSTAPSVSLPSGWVSVGENIGSGVGTDGSADASVLVVGTSSTFANVNFGVACMSRAITSTESSCTVNDNKIKAGSSVALSVNGTGTFTWNNGLGTGASKTVSPSSSTTYTVTVTESGCNSIVSQTITIDNDCDGIADETDIDDDNDGVLDNTEMTCGVGLDANDPDGDGLNSAQEASKGTSPTNADTDGDGINDNLDTSLNNCTVKWTAHADGTLNFENTVITSSTNLTLTTAYSPVSDSINATGGWYTTSPNIPRYYYPTAAGWFSYTASSSFNKSLNPTSKFYIADMGPGYIYKIRVKDNSGSLMNISGYKITSDANRTFTATYSTATQEWTITTVSTFEDDKGIYIDLDTTSWKTFEVNTTLGGSTDSYQWIYKKTTCTNTNVTVLPACIDIDTDGDGIVNRLDLDSDGDGCSDAYEAGATTDITVNYKFSGTVGTNGLIDNKETTADNGTLNYTSTYSTNATNNTIKNCCPNANITVAESSCTANDSKILSGSTVTLTGTGGTGYIWSQSIGGVQYDYYSGSYTVLPDFNSLTPSVTGTIATFDIGIPSRPANDNFAMRFKGYINITTAGAYKFYTSSDDGSKLYIDGTQIVNNDGLHTTQEASGDVSLTSGWHSIEVTFFEQAGGEVLTVSYEGPSIAKQVIPSSILAPNINPLVVTPTATTTYSVTVLNASGCSTTVNKMITVVTAPVATITATESSCTVNDDKVLANSTVNLTSSGGTSYLWSTSGTSATIAPSVSSTTTYSVTVTDANGCTGTTNKMITVVTAPVATITATESSCTANDDKVLANSTVSLTSSGGTSYLWSTSGTSATIAPSVSSTTTYSVTATDANGCTGTTNKMITVVTAPVATITATESSCTANDDKILSGQTVNLTGSGASTIVWNNSLGTGTTKSATPSISTTYSITVTDGNGCVASTNKNITVDLDTDNDCVLNNDDIDDDNDGVTDAQECGNIAGNTSGLTVLSGNINDLTVGNKLLKTNAIYSNGTYYDAVITIVSDNVSTGTIIVDTTASGNRNLKINAVNTGENPYVVYNITFVQSGSATVSSPNGTPVTLSNIYINFPDIDGAGSTAMFSEIVGYSTTLTPNRVIIGNNVYNLGFVSGGAGSTYQYYRANIPAASVSVTDISYHTKIYLNSFSSGNFMFGTTAQSGTAVGNRLIFHEFYSDCDKDNDGVVNIVDLDSDGDGCSDAYEAGATTELNTNYAFTGTVGTNGLIDIKEAVADNGVTNYTGTYSNAIDTMIKSCCPTVNTLSNQTVCATNTVAATNFSGNITSGVTYNWTNSIPSIGLAANGAGNITSFTATNSGSSILIGTIRVTPSTASCVGNSQNFTISVKPKAIAPLLVKRN